MFALPLWACIVIGVLGVDVLVLCWLLWLALHSPVDPDESGRYQRGAP